MQKIWIAIPTIAATAALMLAIPAIAQAASPENPECWGTVTSQRATTAGDVGEHSSAQDEPRLGLANVAEALGLDHVSELGTVLASIDELEETECP